jgi:hypothetical protein
MATPARCLIRLPRGDRYPTVVLRYTTSGNPLGLSARLDAAWPKVELPCLERKWSVWLPPSFAAISNNRQLHDPSWESSSWDERLFGFRPFRLQRRPFDLFSSDDWRRLPGLSVASPAEREAQQCLRRLEELREELATSAGSPPTWGELIAAYRPGGRTASEIARPALCIDETALRIVGITARTPLLPSGPAGQDAYGLQDGSDHALVASSD